MRPVGHMVVVGLGRCTSQRGILKGFFVPKQEFGFEIGGSNKGGLIYWC